MLEDGTRSDLLLGSSQEVLTDREIEELWKLFVAIHDCWGSEACRPEDMASQWRELIHEKSTSEPSYLPHYRSAASILEVLRRERQQQAYEYLFFDPEVTSDPLSPLAHLKNFVVDEFIRVYVASGGFRTYGGANYGGFVSGSRFRSIPPYRTSGAD